MKSLFSKLIFAASLIALAACGKESDPTTFSIVNSTSNYVLKNVMSGEYDEPTKEYEDMMHHGTLNPGEASTPKLTTSTSRYIFFDGVSNTLLRTEYPFSIIENVTNVLNLYDETTVIPVELKSTTVMAESSFLIFEEAGNPEYLEVQLSEEQNY
jgi:hypothetical protein